ncbi:3-deoxy-manno-octulosonate cytidylyltransferase [Streptomyces sp. NPDC058256]|uniref:3-deoxy-manno-octulosonate cytidylyltransferase n=1 Tax=Streptomyces sp. NPDC058256 TaxID=3346408 RepID=UPI0036ED129D
MAANAVLPHPTGRRTIAIIPCRWGSSRFPGKPLALLGDMPLLWHVHQRCTEATLLDDAIVATDDERIEAACRKLGIPCMMTGTHPTGTDRVAECAARLDADAYINVQGDEPFIEPSAIDAVSEELVHLAGEPVAVNAYAKLEDPASVINHNVVKVVTGENENALMFSRQPIPYPRDAYPTYLRQLGLYGFTKHALGVFRRCAQGPLEQAEGIELLRLIEHGHQVRMIPVAYSGLAVDTPEDLERACKVIREAPGFNGARDGEHPL